MRVLLAFVGLVALITVASRDAHACGFVFPPPPKADTSDRLPFLAVEQVLLVWDANTGTEDFVREARFARANVGFGFVVPSPTRPEVFKVDGSPFKALRKAFPYDEPPPPPRPVVNELLRDDGGSSSASARAPVVVLSEQRIGSFTAFVLEANDASGFARWLDTNGFETTAPTRAWLDHYVRMRFYYVALRYDPPAVATQSDGMTSETVRIRFKTPEPFYPYLEPQDHSAPARDRLLLLWFISQGKIVPVARVQPTPDQGAWVQPWSEGVFYFPEGASLRTKLGQLGAILPRSSAPLVVQTFLDRKSSRLSYGDVVLSPRRPVEIDDFRPRPPVEFDDAAKAAHRPLLAVLDPALEPPSAAVSTTPAAGAAPAPPGGSTATQDRDGDAEAERGRPPGALLIGLGAACLAAAVAVSGRRKRRAALSLAFGCALWACAVAVPPTARVVSSLDAASLASAQPDVVVTSPSSSADAAPPELSDPIVNGVASLTDAERAAREHDAFAVMAGTAPWTHLTLQNIGATALSAGAVFSWGVASAPYAPRADELVQNSGVVPKFQACCRSGQIENPGLEGSAEIVFDVPANGVPALVGVTARGGLSAKVATCISSAAAAVDRRYFGLIKPVAATLRLSVLLDLRGAYRTPAD